jgi:uncharacterized protein (TIGR00730 family)
VLELTSVCVYCGSSIGRDPAFAEAAAEVGRRVAGDGLTLVYGGGSVGLMGVVADAALGAGGRVVGVIPGSLFEREVVHPGLTELVEVDSMHDRKLLMYELADAFVALPGGIGTLEELTEVASWAQLGLHSKPVATLDVNGFWQPFHQFLDDVVRNGLLRERNRRLIVNVGDPSRVLDVLRTHEPQPSERLIHLDET